MTRAKAATLIAVCISAVFGVEYLFGAPNDCECRVNISQDMADASMDYNSVGDAKAIIIKTSPDIGGDGGIKICYQKKPNRGNAAYVPWERNNKDCVYFSEYMWRGNWIKKTDTKSEINFDMVEATFAPDVVDEERTRKRAKGQSMGWLDLDRSTNVCKFRAEEWNNAIAGEMTCGSGRWLFNWSSFPKREPFYTRMYYWLHKQKPKT